MDYKEEAAKALGEREEKKKLLSELAAAKIPGPEEMTPDEAATVASRMPSPDFRGTVIEQGRTQFPWEVAQGPIPNDSDYRSPEQMYAVNRGLGGTGFEQGGTLYRDQRVASNVSPSRQAYLDAAAEEHALEGAASSSREAKEKYLSARDRRVDREAQLKKELGAMLVSAEGDPLLLNPFASPQAPAAPAPAAPKQAAPPAPTGEIGPPPPGQPDLREEIARQVAGAPPAGSPAVVVAARQAISAKPKAPPGPWDTLGSNLQGATEMRDNPDASNAKMALEGAGSLPSLPEANRLGVEGAMMHGAENRYGEAGEVAGAERDVQGYLGTQVLNNAIERGIYNDKREDLDKKFEALSAQKPQNLWASDNTGFKVSAIVAIIAGGLSQVYNRTKTNQGLDLINGLVKEDYDRQAAEIETGKSDVRGAYAQLVKQKVDSATARAEDYALKMGQFESKFRELAAKSHGQQAKDNALLFAETIKEQKDLAHAAALQSALSAAGAGAKKGKQQDDTYVEGLGGFVTDDKLRPKAREFLAHQQEFKDTANKLISLWRDHPVSTKAGIGDWSMDDRVRAEEYGRSLANIVKKAADVGSALTPLEAKYLSLDPDIGTSWGPARIARIEAIMEQMERQRVAIRDAVGTVQAKREVIPDTAVHSAPGVVDVTTGGRWAPTPPMPKNRGLGK